MNQSPRLLTAGLLALTLASAAVPAEARTTTHSGRHPAVRHQASRHGATRRGSARHGAKIPATSHQRRACRRRVGCGDTGGTPVGTPSATAPSPGAHPGRGVTREDTPKPPVRSETRAVRRRTAAEDTAAVIAAVLATPCANTEITPTADDIPLVREAVMCLINRERAEHGLGPLVLSSRLESAAEGHCAELISADYFAHISPSGETPVDRIRRTGYIPGPSVGYVIGENLAWGTYNLSTPQSIVAAWIASPGHLANILEANYTETGIGIVPAVPASLGGASPGATYAQEFGVIIH